MSAWLRVVRNALVITCLIAASLPAARANAASGDPALILDYWSMPTTLNPHFGWNIGPPSPTGSTATTDAARLILEPLASIGAGGTLIPQLAATIPTVANGGISGDLRVVTWTLKQGVLWSDGTEFSADDVAFTFAFMRDPAVSATTASRTIGIDSVVATTRYRATVTFAGPTSDPYRFGVGSAGMILERSQFTPYPGPNARTAPVNLAPNGTGPYKVASFGASEIDFVANEAYRGPAPYIRALRILKTSGPVESARAVFQYGTAHYAWNVQLDAGLLRSLIALGNGAFVSSPGPGVEKVVLNRADPAQNSEPSTTHPLFSDPLVRRAFAMAVDRQAVVEIFGSGLVGDTTCNVVTGIDAYVSANTVSLDVCRYDIGRANQLLDEAGWMQRDPDGVRVKNGVRLAVLFLTTDHPLRAREYDVMAAGWRQLGAAVSLRAVNAGTFFGFPGGPSPANNPYDVKRFLGDLAMFTNSPDDLDETQILSFYLTANIPSAANHWQVATPNVARWSNATFGSLFQTLAATADPQERAALIIQMNDLLVSDVEEIPLWSRRFPLDARSSQLHGVLPTAWDDDTWNVADWYMCPASVTSGTIAIVPATGTNTVGATHTVVATLTNAAGRPVPCATVTFTVAGANSTSGTVTTDASGAVTFTYTGEWAGEDSITAASGSVTGTARVSWTFPPSTAGRVTGGGQVATPTSVAAFGITASRANGQLELNEQGGRNVHSTRIAATVISGTHATVYGFATVDGAGDVQFRVNVDDLGEPGTSDSFRIVMRDGYTAGGTLQRGNIQIH